MMKERDLTQLFLKYLKKNKYVFDSEVQFLERRIDIVGKKRQRTIAFELKIENWKKAFQQALSTKICTDYSYIVLFEKFLHRVNIDIFKREGLGVFSIDEKGKVTKKLEAKQSTLIHPSIYNQIAKKLE